MERLRAAFMPAIYADRVEAMDNEVHDFDHFVSVGLASHVSPSVYFDSKHYARSVNLSKDAVPLIHFLTVGESQGHSPHPLVDLAYLQPHPDVDDAAGVLGWLASPAARNARLHPLFWSDYYLATNPRIADKIGHPLHHYLQVGHRRGRSPHPFFAPDHYAEMVDDLDSFAGTPLEHWVDVGRGKDLIPTPLFDPEFYRNRTPVDGDGDAQAFLHFLRQGIWDEMDPHPMFDSAWYRSEGYEREEPPVLHYLRTEHERANQPGPTFDPNTMRRIVVHDDFEFGGRILERYLIGGITAVHVATPLDLSEPLIRQVESVERLLPNAARPFRAAATARTSIRQNFNTHETRPTNALRLLEATPIPEGATVIFVGPLAQAPTVAATLATVAQGAAVILADDTDRGGSLPDTVLAIDLERLLCDIDPTPAERARAVVELLVGRSTASIIGVRSPTFERVVRQAGVPLSQLMSIAVVMDSTEEVVPAVGLIAVVDAIALAPPASVEAFVEASVIPSRHQTRIVPISSLSRRLTDAPANERVLTRFLPKLAGRGVDDREAPGS